MMNTDQIAEEPMQPNLAAVRSTAMDLEQQARTLIRQQPVVALLAAAGFGYLVARLMARGLR